MDFEDIVKRRTATRKFKDKQVDKEIINKILEIGRLAPTAKNLQPQKIYIIRNKDGLDKEVITHAAFYAGWPNAWAVFNMAKEIYAEEISKESEHGGLFGQGEPNTAFAQYFIGNSYLKPLTDPKETVFIANVTFEPGCRNNWHIHKAEKGGGQILVCVDGEGWYQEEGKTAQSLKPGDVVTIPANVKHWHGAKNTSWFSHLAIEVPGENTSNVWLEKVTDEQYAKL